MTRTHMQAHPHSVTKSHEQVFTKSLGVACGISSYTYDLFGDMARVGFARTWSEVFVFAQMFRLKTLHIQHEHGLFWDDNEFLFSVYAFQKKHPDVTIFVTFHSLNLGSNDRLAFYDRLSKVAHLITLNKVAAEVSPFPLHLIEHGVPTSFRPPPARIFRQNHVATFGFWDEEKRHDKLCDLADEAAVALDLYSRPPSEFGLASCDGLVTYYRHFLDTPTLVTRLSEYAALVFLRRPAHEIFAVSGSARMALVARVPVICEDSVHYADLAEAVDLVAYEDIPARIRQVVGNVTLQREMVARQNAFVDRWSEQETRVCMQVCMVACACVCVCICVCMHAWTAGCVHYTCAAWHKYLHPSCVRGWVDAISGSTCTSTTHSMPECNASCACRTDMCRT